jgi:monoterpene epsilon-lactone hydrolase
MWMDPRREETDPDNPRHGVQQALQSTNTRRHRHEGIVMELHRWLCVVIAATVTVGMTFSRSLSATAESAGSLIDPDGTLHVSALTIPPSELWSPEFKKAYVRTIAMEAQFPHIPARNAPKAEWDEFDANYDRFLAGPLAWDLEHYPVDVQDTKIAGVRVGIISPKAGIAAQNMRRVLINLHGGGFVLGRGIVAGEVESVAVASIGRIKVITVDYRQSPYYKYPAASEDVQVVYTQLLKQYKADAIGIFGCSAGGTLTSQVVAWFQAKGLPRPGAVGIFCAAPPVSPELWAGGDSKMWKGGYVPKSPSSINEKEAADPTHWYMEGVDISDPRAYPGSSETVLAKFPPTLLLSGTRSFDMSPAVYAHARFLKLGVDSYLYVIEGGWHGAAVAFTEGTPEAHDAKAYIAAWFEQHLTR